MLKLKYLVASALLGLPIGALAQEEPVKPESRVESTKPAKVAESKIDQWISDLGSDDFDAREEAMEKLTASGAAALKKLETAAKESENKEVRWNARQIIKKIKARPAVPSRMRAVPLGPDAESTPAPMPVPTPRPRAVPQPARPGMGDRLEALQDRIENLTRRHQQLMQEMERLRGAMDSGNWEDVIDHWSQNFDWQSFEPLLENGEWKQLVPQFKSFWSNGGEGESVSVNVGEDGHVRVEVKSTKDGEESTETYEADSVEAFKAEHPEIAEKYGIDGSQGTTFRFHNGSDQNGGGFRVFTAPNGMRPGRPTPPRAEATTPHPDDAVETLPAPGIDTAPPRAGAAPGAPSAPATPFRSKIVAPVSPDRLGVMVETVDEDEGVQGLKVINVEDGGLAAKLGIKAEDIVTKINGAAIMSAEDVKKALSAVKAGGEVKVEVSRSGEMVELVGTKGGKPEAPKEKKLEKF